ncbi:MAG: hypothetical protein JWN56_2988 [Sphingobacteriales bacterium]|nr:hypothetical protein [Sphingobacteriales bacterium]
MSNLDSDLFYSSEHFQAFFKESSQSLILKANPPHFKILAASDKYLKLTHKKREELISKNLFEVFPGSNADHEQFSVISSFKRVIDTKQKDELPVFKYEIFVNASGKYETFYWSNINEPIFDKKGNVAYIINTTSNVTAQIRKEQDLAKAKAQISEMEGEQALYEELAATNEEFLVANEELQQTQLILQQLNLELEERVTARTVELQKAQLEAENQRERLQRLFMEAPAGICMLSGPELTFTLINPLYQQFFLNRNLIGKPVLDALPEIKDQPIYDILKNVYLTGKTFEGRELLVPLARNESSSIEDRYFDFIYQAKYAHDGIIDGVMVFVNEVTHQVYTRKKIEEKEKAFGQMLETMVQISWTNDPTGVVNYYNQRWYDFTGLTYEETKEFGWRAAVHPDDLDRTLGRFQSAMQEGKLFEIETRLKHRDGTYRWHLSRAIPLRDEQDAITMWVGTATDIDEIKLLQQHREEFISIASHELKTPLTSLRGSLQILDRVIKKETDIPFIITQMVNSSNTHLKKVINLVNDLLSSTRIEQGQLTLNKTRFVISKMIDSCCDHIRLGGKYNLNMQGDLELEVFADEYKIDQVIVNFVNNAIKYAPESTEIILLITKEGENAKVSVQDFGSGISPEKIPHLFDRFFRAHNSGIQYSGLGLGLYISQQIIEKHGGQIGVESTLGEGSTFWFTIPIQ